MPFGGIPAETLPFSVSAIREAGLQAKAVQIPDPDVDNKYWSGAVFLISATGTASADSTLKFYGVQAGNIDRREGTGSGDLDDNNGAVPSNKTYNLATKFTVNSNGKYSIDIFHIAKDRGDTNLDRLNTAIGTEYPRNYELDSYINLEDPDSGNGILKKLTTLSSTGTGAYTEIASLDLKKQLRLEDTDKTLDNWNYTILSGNSKIYPDDAKVEGTFYAEVWDNRGASDGSPSSDYMVGGVWLLAPTDGTNKNHNFAAFAQASSPYGGSSGYGTSGTDAPAFAVVSGEATYHGLAAGLYLDNMNKIHRLLGKVKLDVDFSDDSTTGTVEGSVTNFTLGGEKVNGVLLLKEYRLVNNSNVVTAAEDSMKSTITGSINDVDMMGDWSGLFTGPDVTGNTAGTVKKPTGMVGTVTGYSEDEKHTFAVSFGAREQPKPKETSSN